MKAVSLVKTAVIQSAAEPGDPLKHFDRTKFRRRSPVPPKPHGLTLYYYGDGKGKTTAAVGLAIRAKGAGLSVCVVQFMKTRKWKSYERESLQQLGIPVHVLGSGFVGIVDDTRPVLWHKAQAKKALSQTQRLLRSGKHDVVIADEIVSAVDERILTIHDVLRLIAAKPKKVHLVMTGHSAYPALVRASDLVTAMRNVKHPYYTEGLLAQRGIDF